MTRAFAIGGARSDRSAHAEALANWRAVLLARQSPLLSCCFQLPVNPTAREKSACRR